MHASKARQSGSAWQAVLIGVAHFAFFAWTHAWHALSAFCGLFASQSVFSQSRAQLSGRHMQSISATKYVPEPSSCLVEQQVMHEVCVFSATHSPAGGSTGAASFFGVVDVVASAPSGAPASGASPVGAFSSSMAAPLELLEHADDATSVRARGSKQSATREVFMKRRSYRRVVGPKQADRASHPYRLGAPLEVPPPDAQVGGNATSAWTGVPFCEVAEGGRTPAVWELLT